MRKALGFCAIGLVLGVIAEQAAVDMISTSSTVSIGSLPQSLTLGSTQSDTTIMAYEETHDVVLASTLHVDMLAPAEWAPPWDEYVPPAGIGGDLAAGSHISSHLIHFDPIGTPTSAMSGTITFSNPVLGLLVTPESLNGTDSLLGIAGTTYDGNALYRGIEMLDSLRLTLIDPYTVEFSLFGASYMDEFRAITAAPEPVSIALLGAGFVLYLRPRRRGH